MHDNKIFVSIEAADALMHKNQAINIYNTDSKFLESKPIYPTNIIKNNCF